MEALIEGFAEIIKVIFNQCFGKGDLLLKTLLCVVVLDYTTGWLKATINKQLSSSVGVKGLAKKVYIFSIVAVTTLLQPVFNNAIPLRETIIIFYILNESISIVENASYYIPIPKRIKEILWQLHQDESVEEDE